MVWRSRSDLLEGSWSVVILQPHLAVPLVERG